MTGVAPIFDTERFSNSRIVAGRWTFETQILYHSTALYRDAAYDEPVSIARDILVARHRLTYPQIIVRRHVDVQKHTAKDGERPLAIKTFRLEPVAPYRLDLTVWVLKRRPDYIVDRWDGSTYQRTLLIDGCPVLLSVRQPGAPNDAHLDVSLVGSEAAVARSDVARSTIERLLGTTVDLADYYRMAQNDELLGPVTRRFAGFKPTRYPTLFECLTNAITCQQVTLTFGLRVVSRLVERYGLPLETDLGLTHAFPSPAEIVHADPDVLREIGFSRQKARALIELAEGLQSGAIDFGSLDSLDDEAAIKQLVALRGVGRWTAEYTLLRGLGRLHLFPGDDVGARNTLRSWTGAAEPLGYDAVRTTLTRWQPYAGLLYFQMLLLGLEAKGQITATSSDSKAGKG